MSDELVVRTLAIVALPLCVAAALLLLGRRLGREAGWLSLGVLGVVSVLALVLFQDVAGHRVEQGTLRLQSEPTPGVASGFDRAFRAQDRDLDGLLQPEETGWTAGIPPHVDLDGDGVLSKDEAAGWLSQRSSAWVTLGDPSLGPPQWRADKQELWLPLGLRLDPIALVMLIVLGALGLAATLQLLSGDPARILPTGSFAWVLLVIGCLSVAAVCDSLLFALVFWQVAVGAAFLLQQGATLDGAPNRVGVGTLLLLAVGAGALLVACLGLGEGLRSWRFADIALAYEVSAWTQSDVVRIGWTGAALALLVGILLPCLVLPGRPAPTPTWGPAQALWVGVTASGLTLLLRVPLLQAGIAPVVVLGLASVGAALCAARALASPRLDTTLTWISRAQVCGIVAAMVLGCWPAALVQTVTYTLTVGALFLGAESLREAVADWRLDALGGLRRERPWLCGGFVACALVMAAVPPMSTFLTLRAVLVQSAALGGPFYLLAGLLVALATTLSAACLIRIVTLAFRGRRRSLSPAGPASRRRSLALVFLALLAVGAVQPLTGAVLLGSPPAWQLGIPSFSPEGDLQTLLLVHWPGTLSDEARERIGVMGTVVALLVVVTGFGLAWGLQRLWRYAPLAPPGTWFGWLLQIDERVEHLSPQRRVIQPLLRSSLRLAAFDARLERGWSRLTTSTWSRLTQLGGRPPAQESQAPQRTPGGPLLDTLLFLLLLLLAAAALWWRIS